MCDAKRGGRREGSAWKRLFWQDGRLSAAAYDHRTCVQAQMIKVGGEGVADTACWYITFDNSQYITVTYMRNSGLEVKKRYQMVFFKIGRKILKIPNGM